MEVISHLFDTTSWLTPAVQADISSSWRSRHRTERSVSISLNLLRTAFPFCKNRFVQFERAFVRLITHRQTLICQKVNGSNQMLCCDWSLTYSVLDQNSMKENEHSYYSSGCSKETVAFLLPIEHTMPDRMKYLIDRSVMQRCSG